MDATATIRDIIAFAEIEKIPLCVLSIDFKNAFDNIAHEYLFQTLQKYGISDPFIHGIRNMYEGASSNVQINGHSYGPIPIQCGVRQGCPMSMMLYALCLQPFLNFLNRKMAGIKIGNKTSSTAVVAYADDVTIFVTHATELAIVEEAINILEKASGARISPQKSKIITTGGWNTTETIRGIEYHQSATILGVSFWGTTRQTMDDTSARITGKVRIHAQKTYDKDACLAHWMRYANTHLLSKLWYTAQILPAPKTYTQRITAAIAWYIWKGAVFKVPITTLQRSKSMGGWEMIHIEAKCRALLLSRLYTQSRKEGTFTAEWMRSWHLTSEQENPPQNWKTLDKLKYLQVYAEDMAYIRFENERRPGTYDNTCIVN